MNLKNFPRAWFGRFAKANEEHELYIYYTLIREDHTPFVAYSKNGKINFLIVCVDDVIVIGNNLEKMHNVNWKNVSSSRGRGGLGIRKLSSLNKALLGKWCWRFGAEAEGLWKTIIRIKYEAEEGGWLTKDVRGSFGVGLWKEIYKESFFIKQHNNLIFR